MKIALIRRQFSAIGGAELYLQRLLQALADRAHEVHLFAESWSGLAASMVLHKISVPGSRVLQPVRFAEAVRREISACQFDCVFSLERTLKQDVYRAGDGLHRVWLQRRRQFSPWWRKWLVGKGAFHRNMLALEAQTFDPANTGCIIVNSDMVRREILANFNFPSDRIHLVRNGIDIRRFQSGKRAETRLRYGVDPDDYLLLFAGSGWERKGLAYVLDAVRKVQPMDSRIKLLVAGKGRKPGCPPPAARFAGPLPDIENAYAAADLLVFPPIYEPSANVVIEALAAGLPVVTSAYNGASEWIAEGVNGTILPDPSRIDLLVKAILHWRHRSLRVTADTEQMSLARNVAETLSVLELAAKNREAA